jgi:pimeloyl-ACP methyl ester carboxylesterase
MMRTHTELHTPGQRAQTLLIWLPPAEATLESCLDNGIVSELRARDLPVDVWLIAPEYTEVLTWTLSDIVQEHIIAPALAAGYTRIWFAGISLGAFNALHYAASHGDTLDALQGLMLIAPYPGTRDVLRELGAAPDLLTWGHSAQAQGDNERRWWRWLIRDAPSLDSAIPHKSALVIRRFPIHFATGLSDRFIDGQRLLASVLDPAHVDFSEGAHDWPTWRTLWQRWLDQGHLRLSTEVRV